MASSPPEDAPALWFDCFLLLPTPESPPPGSLPGSLFPGACCHITPFYILQRLIIFSVILFMNSPLGKHSQCAHSRKQAFQEQVLPASFTTVSSVPGTKRGPINTYQMTENHAFIQIYQSKPCHHFQGPVQDENADSLVQKLLRISRQQNIKPSTGSFLVQGLDMPLKQALITV